MLRLCLLSPTQEITRGKIVINESVANRQYCGHYIWIQQRKDRAVAGRWRSERQQASHARSLVLLDNKRGRHKQPTLFKDQG